MDSFSAIIDLWPSLAEFASDTGVTPNYAKQMRRRDRINSDYWQRIVAGAEARGIDGVTLERMAALAARRLENNKHPPEAAA